MTVGKVQPQGRPGAFRTGKAWARLSARAGLGLLALLLALLAAGAVAASTSDPDWNGTTPVAISHADSRKAWSPDLAIDGAGRLVVVWSEKRGGSGSRDIYYTVDDGTGWSAPQVVSETTGVDSLSPDLLAVGERHFAAWYDNAGASGALYVVEIGVGLDLAIASPSFLVVDSQPALAASAERLHLVLCAGSSYDLYGLSRPLTGTTWLAPTRVYTSTGSSSTWPAMAAGPDGQTLHLVWEDDVGALSAVRYMSGTVSGSSVNWSAPLTLSTAITMAIRPEVAVDALGNVHVVWGRSALSGDDNRYVYYRRYTGAGWGPEVLLDPAAVRINKQTPAVIEPKVASFEENGQVEVCVSWYGYRLGDYTVEEILLRCSEDGGVTWPTPTENVSRSATVANWEISISSMIAFDRTGRLHAVWMERVGSLIQEDYQVYYAREMSVVYMPLVARDSVSP